MTPSAASSGASGTTDGSTDEDWSERAMSRGRSPGRIGDDASAAEVAEWERDWRNFIQRQLAANTQAIEKVAAATQQTAVILERLNSRMDEQERRITSIELQPTEARARFGTASQVIYTGIAVVALLISLASHITLH